MHLQFYSDEDFALIKHYEISSDQLNFTGNPLEAIKLAKEDGDRHPVLVMEGSELVSFFVLHKNNGVKEFSATENAILLRTFSTDYRHLQKGYAKKALQLLPQFIRTYFPRIQSIVLAVNYNNTIAQSLYEKGGYMDEGERKQGRNGELIIMRYKL